MLKKLSKQVQGNPDPLIQKVRVNVCFMVMSVGAYE